jgi:methylaspartate mutase epsilon subunit
VIKVKQTKIDEEKFMEMRKQTLALWPKASKEIDLDEAVAYQQSLPEDKSFVKVLQKYSAEGKMGLFPRQGTPIVENEIELLQSLNSVGVRLFPFTTDSYTRNLQLDKAQAGLEESIKTGKAKLNGYPLINHGVKTNRRVIESCAGAMDPRCSQKANSLVGEYAFASGMTAMPASFFGWIAGYDKKATVEECIDTAQYLGRLMGYYAEQGVIISSDLHGWLPNGVVPTYVNVATQIIEALTAAHQGCKSVHPQANFQGNYVQDIAEVRLFRKIFRKYLDKYGFQDVLIPGIIASQSPLYAFPQDVGTAYGYICYIANLAATAGVDACSVKTIDEAIGVPSIESHIQTYRAANWIFEVVRSQKIEVNNKDIDLEVAMAEKAIDAIMDKVYELGDGDITHGTIKAVATGVLDSPFSINIHAQDKVLGVRDLSGACRLIEFGNLPLPEDVKDFHREKVAAREKAEGRKMDYYVSIDDFWAISKGRLLGTRN